MQDLGLLGYMTGWNYDENPYSEWLYGDWNEKKLKTFEKIYWIPGVQQYTDYLLDRRADEEYLSRNQLDYTDIHDPRKLKQTSSGANLNRTILHYVSKNIDKLYED